MGFCLVLITTPALAQTRPPVEAFAHLPAFAQPRISPDGKHVAIVQARNGLPVVVIYELGAPRGTKPSVVTDEDWIIESIRWAKNDRLALNVKKSYVAPFDDKVRTWIRELTVTITGGDPVVLNNNQRTLGNNVVDAGFLDVDLDDPDKVFLPLYRYDIVPWSFRLDLLEANAHTGESHSFMAGAPDTVAWYMDGHGHVVARIDETVHPLLDHLKFYDGDDWHDAGVFDATADKGTGLIGLSQDGKSAVFRSYNERGFRALTTTLLAKPGDRSPLFANEQYDVASY